MAEGRDREEFKRSYAAHARANARVCSLGKEPDVTSSRVCLPPSSLTNESSQYVCGALLLLDGIEAGADARELADGFHSSLPGFDLPFGRACTAVGSTDAEESGKVPRGPIS